MKNIAVIGAGAMGNGIAHTFAQSGYKVQLIDVNQEALSKALQTISKNLDRLVSKGRLKRLLNFKRFQTSQPSLKLLKA